MAGGWSIKDIIAHVTTWEGEALTHLPRILAGEKSPRYSVTYGGIDAFNAYLNGRNTFYWDKTAHARARGDYRADPLNLYLARTL